MISASADYDHPPQVVFDTIADVAGHAAWQRGVERIQVVTGDGRGVGTRFVVRVAEGPLSLELEGEVAESRAPTHLRHVLRNSDAVLDVVVRIDDLGGRSRLSYTADLTIRSFALKMLRKVVETKLEEKAAADLERLRAHLDAR